MILTAFSCTFGVLEYYVRMCIVVSGWFLLDQLVPGAGCMWSASLTRTVHVRRLRLIRQVLEFLSFMFDVIRNRALTGFPQFGKLSI